MKLLLDENLPKRLKVDLMEFEVYTVSDNGWAGKKNGELMKLME
jgi:predicted nuclease of predicted toxin-antitoxin system